MDPFRIWKANQSLRTLLLSFLFVTFGLSIHLLGTSANAVAANQPLGGFYSLSSGPYGAYSAGGTAIIDWRDFEPEEGVYRWELLKNPEERFLSWLAVFDARVLKLPPPQKGPVPAAAVYSAYSSGKKVRLKLRVTEGAMPLWLYGGQDVNGKSPKSYGTVCGFDNYEEVYAKDPRCNLKTDIIYAMTMPLYPKKEDNAQPVWWNPLFQEKMIKVLKVIGEFVENDPVYRAAVEFVEASVGSYGEMILYSKNDTFTFQGPSQKLFRAGGYTNARYSEAVQKLLAGYMESFPSFPIALSIGTGLYSSPYDDGSGVTSVLADVLSKAFPKYGSRLYLKFAGFGGNRADHTFKYYCPDKTRCIYESAGGIGEWRIDEIKFPFFCYTNGPIPVPERDENGKRKFECKPSACWKCVDGEEERIIEDVSAGAARFEKVLGYALQDKAYIVMLWHGDWRAIGGDVIKSIPALTPQEVDGIKTKFIEVLGKIAPKLEALGKINPQPPAAYTLSVNKNGIGTGTVRSINLNCGSTCSKTYTMGTPVTLKADPDPGYTFAGWSGDCSGRGTCTVVMNANKTVSVLFISTSDSTSLTSTLSTTDSSTLPITASVSGQGTASPSGTVTASFNPADSAPGLDIKKKGLFDVNGDGKPEILWQHQTRGEVYVWYMDGANLIRDEHIATISDDLNWKIVGVGDFNGDGKADILWHHQQRGEVYVWFMDGTKFLGHQHIRTINDDLNWKVVGVGDFNGDGKADILWHHQQRGEVYVWFMDGATFVRDQHIRTINDDLLWKIAGVGDFNGDGKPDILWHHQQRGDVYVWYMDGAKFLYDKYIRTVPEIEWQIEAIGDYNGDGKPDILWRNQRTGEVYVWFMDGASFERDQLIRVVEDTEWKIVN